MLLEDRKEYSTFAGSSSRSEVPRNSYCQMFKWGSGDGGDMAFDSALTGAACLSEDARWRFFESSPRPRWRTTGVPKRTRLVTYQLFDSTLYSSVAASAKDRVICTIRWDSFQLR